MRRDVFQAIADPNRRAIINLLSTKKLTLNGVAEQFDISRPAISKHIKILTECGLIAITQQGRERYCEARLNKLSDVSQWVNQYSAFWTKKLDALDVFLKAESKAKPSNGKSKRK
ncbi:MAG: winged helix-turn-helix transcriptional regulator [Cyclobacteriaceae bacterium]|nr:winged helix-turn-helix transcriptional regulator [Cyclobacteriaceae bacterium]